MKATKPIIGITCSENYWDGLRNLYIKEKYVRALLEYSDCLPMILPNVGKRMDPLSYLPMLDGIVLTGSFSNVHPELYGQDPYLEDNHYDTSRDATALPLIRACVDHGIPVLGFAAVCKK